MYMLSLPPPQRQLPLQLQQVLQQVKPLRMPMLATTLKPSLGPGQSACGRCTLTTKDWSGMPTLVSKICPGEGRALCSGQFLQHVSDFMQCPSSLLLRQLLLAHFVASCWPHIYCLSSQLGPRDQACRVCPRQLFWQRHWS